MSDRSSKEDGTNPTPPGVDAVTEAATMAVDALAEVCRSMLTNACADSGDFVEIDDAHAEAITCVNDLARALAAAPKRELPDRAKSLLRLAKSVRAALRRARRDEEVDLRLVVDWQIEALTKNIDRTAAHVAGEDRP